MIAGRTSRLEYVLAGVTLFMFAEAFVPRLLAPAPVGATAEVPESTLLRYLWLPFYGLVIVGLIAAGWRSLGAVIRSPWLIALALLAMASTAWSIDPDLSFRRGIALMATTLLGVYLAVRFDWIEALRLLGVVWLILIAMGLVAGVVAPDFAIMKEIHVGAWSGGWHEKNQAGGHSARAVFLFGFLAWRDERWRKLWIGAAVLACAGVIASTSATALLGTMFGVGVLLSAWWMVKGKHHALMFIWLGFSVIMTPTIPSEMARSSQPLWPEGASQSTACASQ
jgi:O-antigen ligase